MTPRMLFADEWAEAVRMAHQRARVTSRRQRVRRGRGVLVRNKWVVVEVGA